MTWPLTLYLHFPWCVAKCPYCDFASRPYRAGVEANYLAALEQELGHWRDRLVGDGRPLMAIFFGGGTPSLLSAAGVARILAAIGSCWPLAPGCEITLEANPESVTPAKLTGYRAAGVNRLSLGAQAMEEVRLRWLGRPHDRAAIVSAVAAARQAGFDNLSLDLIYGSPGHTPAGWRAELAAALALGPDHLSCYQLTVASDTPLGRQVERGQATLPDEERQLELWHLTRATLADAGFPAYEISNFAPPGRECRHNLNYWRFGDYIGLGAAAHSKLTDRTGRVTRFANPPEVEAYQAGLAEAAGGETLTAAEAAAECLIMGLRLQNGMERTTYTRVAGSDLLACRGEAVARLGEAGLLTVTPERVRLTERGLPLANAVMRELL